MNTPSQKSAGDGKAAKVSAPEMLTAEQVAQIDRLLEQVGEFGEVHLIVRKGKLRFISKVESLDALAAEQG